jgi:hypothetical protein
VSFHFSAPILSRLQPQPNNTPATIHAVRISKISISDHLHEHTKLDISVTNRVLGVLLFRANRLLIRANLPDVYRSGSEARPLRGHFADPHLPLRKPWPALAADWPKMARRGTRLVRSEWPKETAMTEIGSTLDPFIEAEIKEHKAALIRLCPLLMLVGFHQ